MRLPSGLQVMRATLSIRNFGIFSLGSAVSFTGTWMHRIAAGWLIWQLTGSGTWLGLIAFADLFPTVVLGPIAGTMADRWDRLKMVRITQVLSFGQTAILCVLTATGQITAELLLLFTLLLGILAALGQPAQLALVPSLVPRADLNSAIAITSVTFNVARFLGPAAAGVIIAHAGVAAAFAANALAFVIFLATLAMIRVAAAEPAAAGRPSFAAALIDGFRYMAGQSGIAAMLVLLVAIGIGGRPVIELLPGFAAAVFASGASGLAMLTSSIGFGAIVGGLWLGGRPHGRGLTDIGLATALVLALSISLFTATDRLAVAIPALVAAGFCMSASGIAMQTLIQSAAMPDMRGRVLSLFGLLFRGGPAIGALIMGALSEWFGLRLSVFLGALLLVAACLWTYRRRDGIAAALET